MEMSENNRNGGDRDAFPPVDMSASDLAKYRALAGDIEISEEELDDFLRTLHEIMAAFVHNAWDVRIIPAFLPEIFADPSEDGTDAVDSSDEEDTDDEA